MTNREDGGTQTGEIVIALRRQAWRGALGMMGISLVCNIGALAVPLFNMQVFNRVMTTHDMSTLAGLVIGLVVGVAFYAVIDHLRMAALRALGDRFACQAGPYLLRAASLARRNAADPSQALRDLETLRQFIGSPLLTAPFELTWTPVLLVVLFLLGWAYAVLAAVCIVVLALLNLLGDSVSRQPMITANEATANGFRDVAGATRGAEAVVAMGMLDTLALRWEAAQNQALSAASRALLRNRVVTAVTHSLRSGMTAAMVATGLVLVLNGDASSGSLVACNMILSRMLMPFEHFAETLHQWADATAAWRRTRGLLNETPPVRYAHALPRPTGHLVVERLVYMPQGADRPVLRGLSFSIDPGEVVGIIGPSASGKSTLLKLVLGMIEPTSGGVFLDGHNTYLWNRADLARHVAYVPQSVALADGTVAENIARGEQPDMTLVMAAARRAGVHAAIADLPRGYATRIGSTGFALSAGQRQRLALARALYGGPQLLVLDEPNAFLDSAGEELLVTLLERLRAEGVGTLISAHRPSVVRAADKLLVMREGMIEHFGPREEVLRTLSGPRVRLLRNTDKAAAS